MPSINRRLAIGTAILLAVVVLALGTAVNYSVHQRAEDALELRLQGLIYGLLGATDVQDDGSVVFNETELPDPQLSTEGTELYAQLLGNVGDVYWESVSRTHSVPPAQHSKIGEWQFTEHDAGDNAEQVGEQGANNNGALYQLQLTILWELINGEELPLIIRVVSDADVLNQELASFRRTLWTSLAVAAILLLLAQAFMLRKALLPLKTIQAELHAIENGQRESLNEQVARELRPLANGLNTLLSSERNRQAEFRHLLDDLAHTLKTPLTVLANHANQSEKTSDDARIVGEQTQQMQASLQHYLERAAGRTTPALVTPMAVLPIAKRLAESLPKIHPKVTISLQANLTPSLQVRVAEADLFEILGNLTDNACKYGATEVSLGADEALRQVWIEDNGRGFAQETIKQLTDRGVRADSSVAGQGLGLTSSRERLHAYGGTMKLLKSDAGGARVVLDFP